MDFNIRDLYDKVCSDRLTHIIELYNALLQLNDLIAIDIYNFGYLLTIRHKQTLASFSIWCEFKNDKLNYTIRSKHKENQPQITFTDLKSLCNFIVEWIDHNQSSEKLFKDIAEKDISKKDKLQSYLDLLNENKKLKNALNSMNNVVNHQTNRIFDHLIPNLNIDKFPNNILGKVHPLTCGNNSDHLPLFPFWNGENVILLCADCKYEQSWYPPCIDEVSNI